MVSCPFLLRALAHKLEQRAEAKAQDGAGARKELAAKRASPRGPRTPWPVFTGVWVGKKRVPPTKMGSVPAPSPGHSARSS